MNYFIMNNGEYFDKLSDKCIFNKKFEGSRHNL